MTDGSASADTHLATGTFDVELTPGSPELDGAVGRFGLRKTYHGDIEGDGIGLMLTAGDRHTGAAGYVAIETVRGRLHDRDGGFALQQFGQMHAGAQTLHYAVVPGSGTGELASICGTVHLSIDPDGTHRYELAYTLEART